MNLYKQNLRFLLGILGLAAMLSLGACKLDDLEDPNNPSSAAIEKDATLAEIQNVVDGIQSGMRNNLPIYFDGIGVLGREFWRFSGSDPRYTTDLLGGGSATLDPGSFYTNNAYASRYRVVRNCNILETAIVNSKAALTEEQRKATRGFSKTIKAHELLLAFNQQWTNGIRVDVADASNLGPFLDKGASLDAISRLLEEGKVDLDAGGPTFPFSLRAGFDGFTTPADFAKLNRAIEARVNAYREQWDGVLTALDASFFDLNGDLNLGAYYIYAKAGGDLLNELYQAPTATGEIRIVHPSFISDADPGDTRLSKAFLRSDAPTQAGLSGSYGFNVYASNTAPIAIIRNEELILLYAEAKIQKGDAGSLTDAVTALNRIRAAAGVGPYTGAMTQAALIDEMLKQRRYSLYGEGHRWIDMRRYNRLNQLPVDRPDDDVWDKFPRPQNE
ncbi:MAG: RagB/SusD family nutrient uptake outer membrane protein [Saprospiraceae bacterium]